MHIWSGWFFIRWRPEENSSFSLGNQCCHWQFGLYWDREEVSHPSRNSQHAARSRWIVRNIVDPSIQASLMKITSYMGVDEMVGRHTIPNQWSYQTFVQKSTYNLVRMQSWKSRMLKNGLSPSIGLSPKFIDSLLIKAHQNTPAHRRRYVGKNRKTVYQPQ